MMSKYISQFNERFALWSVSSVATMTCAYAFAILALVALPQAVQDSFGTGFHPLPLVTWTSQSFLQLVLLSVIMVGQKLQSRSSEQRATEQYNAVMETLTDMHHLLGEEDVIGKEEEEELLDIADIVARLDRIEKRLDQLKPPTSSLPDMTPMLEHLTRLDVTPLLNQLTRIEQQLKRDLRGERELPKTPTVKRSKPTLAR